MLSNQASRERIFGREHNNGSSIRHRPGPRSDRHDADRQRAGARRGHGGGLVVGLLQAVTQIQEQTLSFVPKLVAALAVVTVSMPWVVSRMIEYFRDLVENIPSSL